MEKTEKTDKPRKTRSQKLLETVQELKEKFPFFVCKETDAFISLIKANSKKIDSYVARSFLEMTKKRAAIKYYGMSREQFKAQMKAMMEEQEAIFTRATALSPEEVASIKEMNEKARLSKKNGGKKNKKVADELIP